MTHYVKSTSDNSILVHILTTGVRSLPYVLVQQFTDCAPFLTGTMIQCK